MKAYQVWDADSYEDYVTVIFAETANEARLYALHHSECCMGAEYIHIKARRVTTLDSEYRGHAEMDWYDDTDRMALVKAGWYCSEPEPEDCAKCVARDVCEYRSDNK